jgi:hypothetical protein
MVGNNTPLDSDELVNSEGAVIAAVHDLHNLLNSKNTVMAFTGYFDHLLTTLLLVNVKNKLSASEVGTSVERKVYSVMVECIENVSKHNIVGGVAQNLSTMVLVKSPTKYTIVTGNQILNEEVADLQAKLNKVSQSSLPELKQLYRDQILSKRTDENGAGLGIIDIAIKTGNQIKYDFKPLTASTTFYILQTDINIQQ